MPWLAGYLVCRSHQKTCTLGSTGGHKSWPALEWAKSLGLLECTESLVPEELSGAGVHWRLSFIGTYWCYGMLWEPPGGGGMGRGPGFVGACLDPEAMEIAWGHESHLGLQELAWWQEMLALGSTVKPDVHFTLLLSLEGFLGAFLFLCWASWAWGKDDRPGVNLSFLHPHQVFPISVLYSGAIIPPWSL